MGYGGESWIRDFVMGLPGENAFTIVTTSMGPKNVRYKDFLIQNKVRIFDLTNRISNFPIFIPRGIRTLANILKSSDIVYMMGFPLLLKLFVLVMKKIYGIRTIRGFHSPIQGDRNEPARFARKFLYFNILEPFHLFLDKKFDVIHVLNGESQRFFQEADKDNVVVIPNAINAERYTPMRKFREFTILFIGRLNYQKGADLIGKIVSDLDSIGITYRLLIAGKSDDMRENILKLTAEKGNIEYLGFINDDMKKDILARSSVLISPTRYEGFPLTDLEAMASGTPVISFDVAGPSDFIKDGVNSFLCSDTTEMVAKILKIKGMIEDGTYDNLCRNARTAVERFDWKNIFPEFEELFRKMLNEEIRIEEVPAISSSFRRE